MTAGSCFPLGRGGVVLLNRGGIFRLTAGDIPLDRGGLFKFGNFENRKGAAKPRPLCTPLGLFLECLTVAGGKVIDLCLYAAVVPG